MVIREIVIKQAFVRILLSIFLIMGSLLALSFVFLDRIPILMKMFLTVVAFGLFVFTVKRTRLVFFIWIAMLPFNLFLGTVFPFLKYYSFYLIDLIVLSLFLAMLFRSIQEPRLKVRLTWPIILLIIFVLWLAASVSMHPDELGTAIHDAVAQPNQITINFRDFSGSAMYLPLQLFMRIALYVMTFLLVCFRLSRADFIRAVTILVISSSLMSLVSVILHFSDTVYFLDGGLARTSLRADSSWYSGRASGFFTHPNSFGGFLSLLAPLALAGLMFFPDRKRRLYALLALIPLLLALFVSDTRAAFIGVTAAAALFVFIRSLQRGWPSRKVIALLTLAVLITGIVAVVFFHPRSQRAAEIADSRSVLEKIFPYRYHLWQTTANMIVHHPVFGVGLGYYKQYYDVYAISDIERVKIHSIHPHNLYLKIAAETGLIGLALFLSFLCAVFYGKRDAIKASTRRQTGIRNTQLLHIAIMGAVLSYLVSCLFDIHPFISIAGGHSLFLLLAMLSSIDKKA